MPASFHVEHIWRNGALCLIEDNGRWGQRPTCATGGARRLGCSGLVVDGTMLWNLHFPITPTATWPSSLSRSGLSPVMALPRLSTLVTAVEASCESMPARCLGHVTRDCGLWNLGRDGSAVSRETTTFANEAPLVEFRVRNVRAAGRVLLAWVRVLPATVVSRETGAKDGSGGLTGRFTRSALNVGITACPCLLNEGLSTCDEARLKRIVYDGTRLTQLEAVAQKRE